MVKNTIKREIIKVNKFDQKSVKILSLLTLFILFTLIPLSAQDQKSKGLKIGILPVTNRTKLDYIDTLTTTVEENVFFTATQLENYTIVDGRTEKLSDPKQVKRLKKIAKSKNCHYLITGQVTQARGAYTLTLILYDALAKNGKGEIKAIQEAQFFKLIEVFDVTDRLSISLLEQLTGERIKRGMISFINQTPGTTFQVYVNKNKLEENATSVNLIEGKYTIKIYNTTKRRKKILTQKVVVKEGIPIRIPFDMTKQTIAFDKKNTLRTNLFGMKLYYPEETLMETGIDNTYMGGGFVLPAISYTRLFSETVGINMGIGFIFRPKDSEDTYSEESFGLDLRIGPYFRIGRIGLTPMLGASILFSGRDISEFDLFDYVETSDTSEASDSDNSMHIIYAVELILGFEFFITPMFSLYIDAGVEIGNNIDLTFSFENNQEFVVGFNASVALGLSF